MEGRAEIKSKDNASNCEIWVSLSIIYPADVLRPRPGDLQTAQSHGRDYKYLELLPLGLCVLDTLYVIYAIELVVLAQLWPVCRFREFFIAKRHTLPLHVLCEMLLNILCCQSTGAVFPGNEDLDHYDVFCRGLNAKSPVGLGDLCHCKLANACMKEWKYSVYEL